MIRPVLAAATNLVLGLLLAGSAHAAEKSEQCRFPQNHADDSAAFPADGEEHANLLSALEDSHEHGIHHAQHADEDGQQ